MPAGDGRSGVVPARQSTEDLRGVLGVRIARSRAGASRFLLKDTPLRELIAGVRVVAAGEAMPSPTVTQRLIGHVAARSGDGRRRTALAQLSTLTEREHEALVVVGRGASNAAVGRQLFLSETTVKAHVSRLLQGSASTTGCRSPSWRTMQGCSTTGRPARDRDGRRCKDALDPARRRPSMGDMVLRPGTDLTKPLTARSDQW